MEPTEVTFTSRREDKGAVPAASGKLEARFWLAPLPKDGEPAPDVHMHAVPWAERLWEAWRPMRKRDREHDLIYENRQLRAGGRLHPGVRSLDMAGFETSRLFVTTSIVDTFQARLAKRKSMPMFVVDDAEWKLKQQAQEFRRWLHGKLREADFERIYTEVVRDALIRGDGVVYVSDDEDDVTIERVHRSELLIDPYEAEQGEKAVRTIYRLRTVSRDALISQFPEHEAAILAAPAAPDRADRHRSDWLSRAQTGERDVVDFIEAWHLPVRCDDEGDGGGRWVQCLANKTLGYGAWKVDRFPFSRLPCYKPTVGYWSSGVVERLRGLQSKINQMIDDISQNISVTGKGIWMVPEQFDMPVEKLTGYRPFKLSYKGVGALKPEFVHPQMIGGDAIPILEKWEREAHDLVGVPQWSAQGRSSLGMGASGVALDTQEDLLSDRHSVLEENCSHFRLDAAQCLLDGAMRVAEACEEEEGEGEEHERAEGEKKKRKRGYMSSWMDKGRLERLDWHQVALTKDQYRLQLEPTSSLPSTRAGKYAAIAEMIKTGVIKQEQAADLYDEPDIAHHNRVELAPKHNAQRIMEVVGNLERELPVPEEWHDHTELLRLCKCYYNRAQNELAGAKDQAEAGEVLKRYREFGDMVLAVQKLAKKRAADEQAAAQPPAPMGAAPGGPPMPAPPMDMTAAPIAA